MPAGAERDCARMAAAISKRISVERMGRLRHRAGAGTYPSYIEALRHFRGVWALAGLGGQLQFVRNRTITPGVNATCDRVTFFRLGKECSSILDLGCIERAITGRSNIPMEVWRRVASWRILLMGKAAPIILDAPGGWKVRGEGEESTAIGKAGQ